MSHGVRCYAYRRHIRWRYDSMALDSARHGRRGMSRAAELRVSIRAAAVSGAEWRSGTCLLPARAANSLTCVRVSWYMYLAGGSSTTCARLPRQVLALGLMGSLPPPQVAAGETMTLDIHGECNHPQHISIRMT